jgi:hypothetical protein
MIFEAKTEPEPARDLAGPGPDQAGGTKRAPLR